MRATRHLLPKIIRVAASLLASGIVSAAAQTSASLFAGHWDSDFGLLDLTQDGAHVSGTYSCCNGKISGEVIDGELRFTWRDEIFGEGRGVFTLEPGGALKGRWHGGRDPGQSGSWAATRVRTPEFKGVRTLWTVSGRNSRDSELTGSAELFLDGVRIAGRLQGKYEMRLPVQGAPDVMIPLNVHNDLDGTLEAGRLSLNWRNPLDGSSGSMTLSQSGEDFEGSWQTRDGSASGTIAFHRTQDTIRLQEPRAIVARQQAVNEGRELLESGSDKHRSGDSAGALAEFTQAERRFREASDPNRVAAALMWQAMVHSDRAEYEAARQKYAEVLALDGASPENRALAETSLNVVNLAIGLPPTQAVPPITVVSENVETRQAAERNLFAGEYDEAIRLAEHALSLYSERIRGETNPLFRTGPEIDLGRTLEVAGVANVLSGRQQEALRRFDEALGVWRGLDARRAVAAAPAIARTLGMTASVFAAMGDEPAAALVLDQAINIQERANDPSRWVTYYQLARLLETGARSAEAATWYERAISTIEEVRNLLVTDETKIAFLGQSIEPYRDFVAYLMRRNAAGSAAALDSLAAAERARARAQLDRIAGAGGAAAPGSERHLLGETWSRVTVNPLDRAQILELARRGTATYLVYFVAREGTCAWVLRPDGEAEAFVLPIARNHLTKLVAAARDGIRENKHAEPLRALFAAVVRPVLKALEGSQPGTPLVIVPHDQLNLIPFAALFDGETSWGLNREFSVVPSLSILAELKSFILESGDRLLAIGRPEGAQGLALSEAEVAAVSEHFPGRVTQLLGSAAGKAEVLSALPDYQLVLFSTHGRPDARGNYLLELARGTALGAPDIQLLDLSKVKLAVLSACDTHSGTLFGGDELMSLARAFLTAGAKAVLVTLWPVHEEATAAISADFFANLKSGLAPAEALRQAQFKYLRSAATSFRDPVYWAPWVLIGRSD